MKTIIYTHPDCALHNGQSGYFENPERLAAVERGLKGLEANRLEAPIGKRADILRVHSERHIETVFQSVPDGEVIALCPDAGLDQYTAGAALRGIGAACESVDKLIAGEAEHAFIATRPPGHHTEPQQAMGFCYFSTIAIAAKRARAVHGVQKIAIIDFDVHHGNGTQACLQNTPNMLFASIHQHPHYPNTGTPASGKTACKIINLPLPGGTSARAWREAFEAQILSRLRDFSPDMLFVSAGFDAHKDDPLGDFQLTEEDYARLGSQLASIANGRMLSVLEGGYNLTALENSVRAYIQAVLAA